MQPYKDNLSKNFRVDIIKVLEKKFQELESRLTLQDPSRGLTLRELVSLRASQIPDEISRAETQENLRIELEKVNFHLCIVMSARL